MDEGTSLRSYLRSRIKSEKDKRELYRNLLAARIAADVSRLRTSRKLSQAKLAGLAETSQPSIARLESGRYGRFSTRTLIKIAEALQAELVISLRERILDQDTAEMDMYRQYVIRGHLAAVSEPYSFKPIAAAQTEKASRRREASVG